MQAHTWGSSCCFPLHSVPLHTTSLCCLVRFRSNKQLGHTLGFPLLIESSIAA